MADKDASCSPDQNAARPDGRYGEHTAGGGASFRCGACGEVAAMVKLLRSGEVAAMGPPLGPQRQAADGVIIDYWLGSTCWMAVNTDRWGASRPSSAPSALIPVPCTPSTGNSRRSGAPNARPVTTVTTGGALSSSTAPSTTTPTANAQLATAT